MKKEERRRKLELQAKYNMRISIVKAGRESFLARNYGKAAKHYTEYLTILAEAKEAEDIFSLSPENFEEDSSVSELLLISHVYWELSRMYEGSEKLESNYKNSLQQFIKFTSNQPYQVLNAELVRKYLRKNSNNPSINREAIKAAYSQIFIESNSCFIASYAFGETNQTTQVLRKFKLELIQWPFGHRLVTLYYKISPYLVDYFLSSNNKNKLARLTIIPPLRFFAFFTQTSIFNTCSYFLKLLQKLGLNRF